MKRLHLLLLLIALQPGCTVSELRSVAAQPQAGADPGTASEPLDVLQARARQTYADGQFDESAKAYKAYLERAPGEAQAWLRLGNAYARTARPDEAVTAYREAVIREPALAKAWHNMGVIQLQQAANSFQQQLLHAQPGDPMTATGEQTRAGILRLLQGGAPPVASASAQARPPP